MALEKLDSHDRVARDWCTVERMAQTEDGLRSVKATAVLYREVVRLAQLKSPEAAKAIREVFTELGTVRLA